MSPTPKQTVRKGYRERRRSIAAQRDTTADDRSLAARGVALAAAEGVQAGGTVALYEARPVEPPTAELTAALRERGIRVIVPITLPDLDLDWHDAADPDRTPLGVDAIGQAGLVLAPGLAVDRSGTRLGQGGGCYDKTLPRRRSGTPVVVLLHPGELVTGPLPREPHDTPVDGVLTADGLHRFPARTRG